MKPTLIDHVTVVCDGCKKRRKLFPDAALPPAELAEWMRQHLTRCLCGSSKADLLLHLRKEPG